MPTYVVSYRNGPEGAPLQDVIDADFWTVTDEGRLVFVRKGATSNQSVAAYFHPNFVHEADQEL